MNDYESICTELCKALQNKVPDQFERIMKIANAELDCTFVGFVEQYHALSLLIPLHWTVVDIGCAYAPQSYYFRNHKHYIGIDLHHPGGSEFDNAKFKFTNSKYFIEHVCSWIETLDYNEDVNKYYAGCIEFDLAETFAIMNYVPGSGREFGLRVRTFFRNLFVYYPSDKNRKELF